MGIPEICQKMGISKGIRKDEQGFSSFIAKFLPYVMQFQSFVAHSVRSTLQNNQIRQKIRKKMKKSLFQHAFNPFLPWPPSEWHA